MEVERKRRCEELKMRRRRQGEKMEHFVFSKYLDRLMVEKEKNKRWS